MRKVYFIRGSFTPEKEQECLKMYENLMDSIGFVKAIDAEVGAAIR